MRFISSFFWSFVLVQMASYVISSMTGGKYDFSQATIISLVVALFIIVISSVIPNEPAEQH